MNTKPARHGALAKWLPPGVKAAFDCYRKLPRDTNIKAFLVPAHAGTKMLSVPKAFHTFCNQMLPTECTKPTVNLMRKFFHKTLISLTQSE